ncbi:ribonuclease inhibitor-like isoform X2 [Osmerus eperlanus]|uniref:ribonuclease inhibitor-like isoform X2 n=1 Tax=Osmerus eperlanus TaxID=29151 RepID=UPI002E0F1A27
MIIFYRLSGCHITEEGCASLGSVLKSTSFLRQLDLRNNDLKDAGMKLLSAGLGNPLCKLETLRLSGCHITEEGCASLGSALKSTSFLRQLDLSNNDLKDAGMKLLSAGLGNPLCKLETLRLPALHLTAEGCASLASALKSKPSLLRDLDLSNSDLRDSDMKLLSAVLGNPLCKLETLRLSGCHIAEEGCASLASALKTNHPLLRDLDLSNSDLKDSGMKLLSAVLEDPLCKLETLRLSCCGVTEEGCASLASALRSNPSTLRELDLSYNDLQIPEMQLLSDLQWNPLCKLETLRVSSCDITEEACASLASALKSKPSSPRELDLSNKDLRKSDMKLLSAVLRSPLWKLETLRLSGCHITEEGCASLGSVLKSTSFLRQLDLSNNDAGMKLLSAGLGNPLCKLETLRLSCCGVTEEGCASLASALKTNPSLLRDLDLSNSDLRKSDMKLLSAVLGNPLCKLETLRLSGCHIAEEGCASLASALKTNHPLLRDLDLSNSDLKDSDMKLLSAVLEDPLCKLETLRLSCCGVTEEGCASLASALRSNPSTLRELDLSYNDLQIPEMQLLSDLQLNPLCKLEKLRVSSCDITEEACASLASALKSKPSSPRELDLSNKDLRKSDMKLLSAVLRSPLWKLETLRLSGCLVTEEGCASLASALRSNPFHLRELDLSYNHPGEKGSKLLSAGLEDPHCRLEKLNVDHGGECWIKPGLRKYACELTLDPNTAHRELSLSEENRKVTWRWEEQPYPDHPERFEDWPQVLCREGLSGRCYWEAEWSGGGVDIAVTYKGISRRGEGDDSGLGYNNKSWSLDCDDNSYSAWHNKKSTDIPAPPSHRVGVYLDWPAGTLSFYTVSSDTLTHLHTFHSTFTEPLYPGFYVHPGSSVSLCQVE